MHLLSSSRRQHFALVYITFHLIDSRLLYHSIKTIQNSDPTSLKCLQIFPSSLVSLLFYPVKQVINIAANSQTTFIGPIQLDKESFISNMSTDFNFVLFLFICCCIENSSYVLTLLKPRGVLIIFSPVPARLFSLTMKATTLV